MKELDVVVLRSCKNGVLAGTHGTIIHKHLNGNIFAVEFCDEAGRTIAIEDLSPNEVELLWEFKP